MEIYKNCSNFIELFEVPIDDKKWLVWAVTWIDVTWDPWCHVETMSRNELMSDYIYGVLFKTVYSLAKHFDVVYTSKSTGILLVATSMYVAQ